MPGTVDTPIVGARPAGVCSVKVVARDAVLTRQRTVRALLASIVLAVAMGSTALPAAASLLDKTLSTSAACQRIDKIMSAGSGGDPREFVDRLLSVSDRTQDKTIRREVERIAVSSLVLENGGTSDRGIKKGSANLGDYCRKYV